MYYPYFRGKQFDLFALQALAESGKLSKRIRPVIEPIKDSKALLKVISTFKTAKQPFYLIQNPQTGDFLTAAGLLQLKNQTVPKAMIVEQSIDTIDEQPDLWIAQEAAGVLASDWQYNQVPVAVSQEFRLLQKIRGPKILISDPFTRLPKNSYYQELPDEFFSSNHLDCAKKGFSGFMDFSIDSRIYYEQSYPAKALALHLVYFQEQQLRIHHFLSQEDLPSQKAKFFDLMEQVLPWQEQHSYPTVGLDLLKEAYSQDKFPGMGVMRKVAVMHHLELMSNYLDNQ